MNYSKKLLGKKNLESATIIVEKRGSRIGGRNRLWRKGRKDPGRTVRITDEDCGHKSRRKAAEKRDKIWRRNKMGNTNA